MKFKAVAILIPGGHFNQDFYAVWECSTPCAKFHFGTRMQPQERLKFWPNFAFLLEQKINFLFAVTLLINLGQLKMTRVWCQYDSICSFMGSNRPAMEAQWLIHPGDNLEVQLSQEFENIICSEASDRPLNWPRAV